MHTPVMRDYFFAGKHSSCNFEGGPSKCLVCEVYTLYQEVRFFDFAFVLIAPSN